MLHTCYLTRSRAYTCCALVILFAFGCTGNEDSNAFHERDEATGQVKKLNELAAADTAPFEDYYRQALDLAQNLKDSVGEIQAHSAMGDHYFDAGDLHMADVYYEKAIELAVRYGKHTEEIIDLGKRGLALEEDGQRDEAERLYRRALAESVTWGPKEEEAIAHEQLGIFYMQTHDNDSASVHLNTQLELTKELNDSARLAKCLNNLGYFYNGQADYVNAISHYRTAMNILERLDDSLGVARCHVNIGIAYKEEGAYDLALESLLDGSRYFERSEGRMELASCYNTIGNIQMEIGNTDSALTYFFRSLQIRRDIGNRKGEAGSLTNIGNVFLLQHHYDSALWYLKRSLEIKNELGDSVLIASSDDLMGEVFFHQSDFNRADQFYTSALRIRRNAGDQKGAAKTLNNLGELYTAWHKPVQAIMYLREADQLSRAIGVRQVHLRSFQLLTDAYRSGGNLDSSLYYYDQYTLLHDSIFNERQTRVLSELQIKYETEKREQQIFLLNEQEKLLELEVSQGSLWNFILGLIAAILVLVAILGAMAYRGRNKIIAQKQTIINQKQTMMRELHHRIKNNLQTIASMLELQADGAPESSRSSITDISVRLNAMLLIHRNLYSADSDGMVDMRDYLEKLTKSLRQTFGKGEKVEMHLQADQIFLEADVALNIGFICNEVITNALKHAFTGVQSPAVSVYFKQRDQHLVLEIADNGVGIPKRIPEHSSESFGLKLIDLFSAELKSTATFTAGHPGTLFRLTMPKA